MTISHSTAQEWMQRQLEGPLEKSQRAALEEHLASCQDCQVYRARLGELHENLPRAAASAWPEPSLSSKEIEHQLAVLHRNQRRMSMNTHISTLARTAAAIAGAAILVLVIVFAMKTIPGSPTSPGSAPQTTQAAPDPSPTAVSQPISYTSPSTGLTLTIPAGWESQGEDAFKGADGFLEIAPFAQPAADVIQACELEANTHPEYYGPTPEVRWIPLDSYTGCMIWSGLKNGEEAARSTLILEFPQAGQFLTLVSDPSHFDRIVTSLRFPQPVATKTPGSNKPIDSNPPVSNAQQESGIFGSLIWEDYNIVPETEDSPTHFEFNKRIPPFVFDQRQPWRQVSIQAAARQANVLLEPFGYELKPELWSSVSPDMYALYKGDQIAQADVSFFSLVSVNASGTDFVMVVDILNGGSRLIQKDKIEDWDASRHAYQQPVYSGDDLVTLERGMNASDEVQVVKSGQVVYTFSTVFVVEEPVKMFGVYQGQWVLEVDGNLIVDGKILNQELGYTEIFNWQLLHGKPFYFFLKDGKVGLSYDGEILPVQYDQVIHYACCEPAAFNPGGYPDMIAFYALKDGNWHYVELGNYSQMPAMEPTATPIPAASSPCNLMNTVRYDDAQGRFCFAFPPRFQQTGTSTSLPGLFGPPDDNSSEPVRATLEIEIQPLQIETDLKTAVDVYLSQYNGSSISRTSISLDGEPAEIVEGVPSRSGSRELFAIHGQWLYHLIFTPSTNDFPQVKADVDELFDMVLKTFTFLQ